MFAFAIRCLFKKHEYSPIQALLKNYGQKGKKIKRVLELRMHQT